MTRFLLLAKEQLFSLKCFYWDRSLTFLFKRSLGKSLHIKSVTLKKIGYGVRANSSLKGDRKRSLGTHMTHSESNTHSHLDSAKEELKSAAAVVVEEAKEKVEEVVAKVAEKVGEAADHVQHEATK
jgi:hypothetical protein